MNQKDKYEQVGSIGGLDVNMQVEAVSLSVHRFDDMHGALWYEVHITLNITLTFHADVKIHKTSKLRYRLDKDEVELFNEKGFINIDINEYKQQFLGSK